MLENETAESTEKGRRKGEPGEKAASDPAPKPRRERAPALARVSREGAATVKGEETRRHILETALRLFRERGFEQTGMRDVATEAEMALGAAYYYFPSKDAIVAAYYDLVQQKHSEVLATELPKQHSLKERLALIHNAKLDILRDDRPLMGALLRYTGHPDHPLSFFGKETEHIRKANEEIFADALKREKLPQDLCELLPKALWALHMGFLLYYLYDKTEGQTRTRKLVNGATEFTVQMISVAKFPLLKPIRKQVMTLLKDAGLI